MRKKLFTFLLIGFSCSLASMAQDKGVKAVKQLGNIMSNWCRENDMKLLNDAAKLCPSNSGEPGKDCTVSDSLMYEFIRRSGEELLNKYSNYSFRDYMDGFQYEMDKAVTQDTEFKVRISNVRPASDIQFDNESMTDEKRFSLYYVLCDVEVSGSMNYTSKDLFCVRKGSGLISQIGPSGQPVNTSKILDWDHIAAGEFNSLEVSYGYSKNFPLNVCLAASFSYFNIGLEYGQKFSEELLTTQMHTNFATSTLERGKYWYLMMTPGIFIRYASLDFGLGNVFAKYNYNYESVYTSSSNIEKKNYFIMKPKLTFNIPIPLDFSSRGEKFYISPHVGYQYVPKCSTLNCWEVGIGVRFRFETY